MTPERLKCVRLSTTGSYPGNQVVTLVVSTMLLYFISSAQIFKAAPLIFNVYLVCNNGWHLTYPLSSLNLNQRGLQTRALNIFKLHLCLF